ncbi:hypothetical protein [Luteimonas sp. e5]
MSLASPGRAVLLASLAATLALTSGCSWFRKDTAAYKLSGEARPLEVPPDLQQPDTSGAMNLPPSGGVSASSMARPAAAASPTSFRVPGAQRDEVFARLGEALEAVEGLTIASRANLLGTYDVSYGGSNFLVRSVQVTDGVTVAAVDPRGLAATGEAASSLIAQLKVALGGQ